MQLTQRLIYQRRKPSSNDNFDNDTSANLPLRANNHALRDSVIANPSSLKKLSTLIFVAAVTTLIVLQGIQYHCSSVWLKRISFLHPSKRINKMLLLTSNNKQKKSSQRKSTLSPKRWRGFSYQDLHDFFECESIINLSSEEFLEEDWHGLQQYYKVFADRNRKIGRTYGLLSKYYDQNIETDDTSHVTHPTDKLSEESSNIRSFFRIRKQQSASKQLYLKATQDIPANTTISTANNNTVVFSNGRLFRKFIWGAYHEYHNTMACHLIEGARVVQSLSSIVVPNTVNDGISTSMNNGGDNNDPVIVLDLDASLLATVTLPPSTKGDNVDCTDNVVCRWKYITKRDIRKGEILQTSKVVETKAESELLVDRWKLVGLS